jgi:hypothetical protein
MKGIDHCSQIHCANDQDVDVASCPSSSFGKRSVDECRLDLLRHRCQSACDDIGRAGRFAQHPCDFFENRTGAVGAEERLITAFVAPQQPRVDEAIQLAKYGPRRQSGAARNLTSVQRLVRSEQQQAQYAAAIHREKDGCKGLLHNWQRLSPFLQQPGNRTIPCC